MILDCVRRVERMSNPSQRHVVIPNRCRRTLVLQLRCFAAVGLVHAHRLNQVHPGHQNQPLCCAISTARHLIVVNVWITAQMGITVDVS